MNELEQEIQDGKESNLKIIISVILIALLVLGVYVFYFNQPTKTENTINNKVYSVNFGSIEIKKHEFYSNEKRFSEITAKSEKIKELTVYALIPKSLAVKDTQVKLTGDGAVNKINDNPLIFELTPKFKPNELNEKIEYANLNEKCILIFPFATKMINAMTEEEKTELINQVKSYNELNLNCKEINELELKLSTGIYEILKEPFALEFKKKNLNLIEEKAFFEADWFNKIKNFLSSTVEEVKTKVITKVTKLINTTAEQQQAKNDLLNELKKIREENIKKTQTPETKGGTILIEGNIDLALLRNRYKFPKEINLVISEKFVNDTKSKVLLLPEPVIDAAGKEITEIKKPKISLSKGLKNNLSFSIEGTQQPYILTLTAEYTKGMPDKLSGEIELDYTETELFLRKKIKVNIVNSDVLQALSDVPEYWLKQDQIKNYITGQIYYKKALEEEENFYLKKNESLKAFNVFIKANEGKEIEGILPKVSLAYTLNCDSITLPELAYNGTMKLKEFYQANCESLKASNNARSNYKKTIEYYLKALKTENKEEPSFNKEQEESLLIEIVGLTEKLIELDEQRIEQLKLISSLELQDLIKTNDKINALPTGISEGVARTEIERKRADLTISYDNIKKDFEFIENRIDYYQNRSIQTYNDTIKKFNEIKDETKGKELVSTLIKIIQKEKKLSNLKKEVELIEKNPYALKKQEEIISLQKEINNLKLSIKDPNLKVNEKEYKTALLESIKEDCITYLKADSEELNEILKTLEEKKSHLTSPWLLSSTYFGMTWILGKKGGQLNLIEDEIYSKIRPMKEKIDAMISQLENKKDASIKEVYDNLITAKIFSEDDAPTPIKIWVEIEEYVNKNNSVPAENVIAEKYFNAANYYLSEETKPIAIKKYDELINNFIISNNPETKTIVNETQDKLFFEVNKYKDTTETFMWKLDSFLDETFDLKWWLAFEAAARPLGALFKSSKTGQEIMRILNTEVIKTPEVITTFKKALGEKIANLIRRGLARGQIIENLEKEGAEAARSAIVTPTESMEKPLSLKKENFAKARELLKKNYLRLKEALLKKREDPIEMLVNSIYKSKLGTKPTELREVAFELLKGKEDKVRIIGKLPEEIGILTPVKETLINKLETKNIIYYYIRRKGESEPFILMVPKNASPVDLLKAYEKMNKLDAVFTALKEGRMHEFFNKKVISDELLQAVKFKKSLLGAALKDMKEIPELKGLYLKTPKIEDVKDIVNALKETGGEKTVLGRGGELKLFPKPKEAGEIVDSSKRAVLESLCGPQKIAAEKIKIRIPGEKISFLQEPTPGICNGNPPIFWGLPETEKKIEDITLDIVSGKTVSLEEGKDFEISLNNITAIPNKKPPSSIVLRKQENGSVQFTELPLIGKTRVNIDLPDLSEREISFSIKTPGKMTQETTRINSKTISDLKNNPGEVLKKLIEGETIELDLRNTEINEVIITHYKGIESTEIGAAKDTINKIKVKNTYIFLDKKGNKLIVVLKDQSSLSRSILDVKKPVAKLTIKESENLIKLSDYIKGLTKIKDRQEAMNVYGESMLRILRTFPETQKNVYGLKTEELFKSELIELVSKTKPEEEITVGVLTLDSLKILNESKNIGSDVADRIIKEINDLIQQKLKEKVIEDITVGQLYADNIAFAFKGKIPAKEFDEMIQSIPIEIENKLKAIQFNEETRKAINIYYGTKEVQVKEIGTPNTENINSLIKDAYAENSKSGKAELRLKEKTPNIQLHINEFKEKLDGYLEKINKAKSIAELDEIKKEMDLFFEKKFNEIAPEAFTDETGTLIGDQLTLFLLKKIKKRFSFMVMDIASLGKINEELGSVETDKFLKKLFDALKIKARENDALLIRKNPGSDEIRVIFKKELTPKELEKIVEEFDKITRKTYLEFVDGLPTQGKLTAAKKKELLKFVNPEEEYQTGIRAGAYTSVTSQTNKEEVIPITEDLLYELKEEVNSLGELKTEIKASGIEGKVSRRLKETELTFNENISYLNDNSFNSVMEFIDELIQKNGGKERFAQK